MLYETPKLIDLYAGCTENFHARGLQQLCKFLQKEESVYIRKEFISHTTTVRHTNIAAVLLFWETNMTDNDDGSIQPGSFITNKSSSYQKKTFAPCKGIQDSLEFWILRRGFRFLGI